MKIGIGIDTGGTYTDAVIYDFDKSEILGSAKSLTTKEDLSKGILSALDKLPPDLITQAKLVSLSTTLATNACVEDKGGAAKLIFFGGDERVITKLGKNYGLPPVSDIYIQESYSDFSGVSEKELDWDLFSKSMEQGFKGFDGIGIVEMNATKNGAQNEKKAKKILMKEFDLPVVCGHELFCELNSLQRASSTLLNARLFPVIKEFLNAIKTALAERNINADMVIVKSDGSLMSEKFAAFRPVETLLCGPAASVIGGCRLANSENSIIVDMGGTTTDIALVKNNIPVSVLGGVNIGKWKTFVDGLYVKTFGLGGDSAVHYNEKQLILEEYRIVPLCVAAEKYPVIIENLKKLVYSGAKHTRFLHEHYILVKDINGNDSYSAEEKRFCSVLKPDPLSISEAPKFIDKDMYTINVSRLLKEGIVQICGLTPTDIMHIKNDFNEYSSEASQLGAMYISHNMGISVPELCEIVYYEIKKKMYRNIVEVMLENKKTDYMKNGVNNDVKSFIDESYEIAAKGQNDSLLSMMLNTEFSLVGIGAPIKIFLDDVAKMLGTKAIIAEHFEVANALGAIVSNIFTTHTIEIQHNYDEFGNSGYTVFGNDENRFFKDLTEAEGFAISEAKDSAVKEAVNCGAKGEITTTHKLDVKTAYVGGGTVHLGTTVTAQAAPVRCFV